MNENGWLYVKLVAKNASVLTETTCFMWTILSKVARVKKWI